MRPHDTLFVHPDDQRTEHIPAYTAARAAAEPPGQRWWAIPAGACLWLITTGLAAVVTRLIVFLFWGW
jgi:hypothetical protein